MASTTQSARSTELSRDSDSPEHVNEVRLVGVLATSEMRTLPSGDELLSFRVTVRRPPVRSRRSPAADATTRRAPTVDAIECVAGTAAAARGVRLCAEGDLIEVAGRLQRRFWRSTAGPACTYQIEAVTARRVPGARARQRSAG